MEIQQIQAIGNFLQYYYTDMMYIKRFHDHKNLKIPSSEYIMKKSGTFYAFLIEYRVIRNLTQGCADRLLKITSDWVNSKNADNVDLFAERLSKSELTRGHVTTSLASKILFLNNPWKILPMDTLTRKAFKQYDNKYSTYILNLEKYRQSNKSVIEKCIFHTKALASIAEQEFKKEIKDLNIIHENRIIDKLLWSTR